MKTPTVASRLGHFMGMGMDNQLGKFSSNLAELPHPSGNSSVKSHHGFWVLTKTRAFTYVKKNWQSQEFLLSTILMHQPKCVLMPPPTAYERSRHRVETDHLCNSINDRNGTTLRTDQKEALAST